MKYVSQGLFSSVVMCEIVLIEYVYLSKYKIIIYVLKYLFRFISIFAVGSDFDLSGGLFTNLEKLV